MNILDAVHGLIGVLSGIDLPLVSSPSLNTEFSLTTYLTTKMNIIAPSLAALLGDRMLGSLAMLEVLLKRYCSGRSK